MTLDEFELVEPHLARELRAFAGDRFAIDGVYRDEGRWEAHVTGEHGFEVAVEARCLPACREARRFAWTWLEHVCCAACETDPSHRYRSVHE